MLNWTGQWPPGYIRKLVQRLPAQSAKSGGARCSHAMDLSCLSENLLDVVTVEPMLRDSAQELECWIYQGLIGLRAIVFYPRDA